MSSPIPKRYARWAWLLLPLITVLAFNKIIVYLLTAWHQTSGRIPPAVFFFLPFLSIFPPLLLLAIWYIFSFRNTEYRHVIYNRATLISDTMLGIAIGVICIFVFIGSLKMLSSLGIGTPNLTSLSLWHHLFFSTIGAMIPGISEELYFRGFLMARFRDMPPWLIILLTSISFALWHVLSPIYLLHTFVIGIILGSTVLKTQRVLSAIIAHSLANTAAGLLIIKGWV